MKPILVMELFCICSKTCKSSTVLNFEVLYLSIVLFLLLYIHLITVVTSYFADSDCSVLMGH